VTKKGGGSTELNEFIRLAKNRGAPLPVATASAESRLARAADVAWFFRKRRTRIRAALSRWGRAWPPPCGAMRWRSFDADQWLQLERGHRRTPIRCGREARATSCGAIPAARSSCAGGSPMKVVAGVDSSTQSCTVVLRAIDSGKSIGGREKFASGHHPPRSASSTRTTCGRRSRSRYGRP
jgi:hypothetical protein